MIELTRLNKKKFLLNCDLIEAVESTPDTVITLRNGKLCIVEEAPTAIAEMVLQYRRSQFSDLLSGIAGLNRTISPSESVEEESEE